MDRAAVIRELEQEQSALRDRAFGDARLRRETLFARHAELEPLYEAAEGIYPDALERGVREPARYARILEEADREYARLAARLDAALAQCGVVIDELRPRFECALCEDRGYVTEPRYARCACFERKLSERLAFDASRSGHTFEAFDATVFPDTKVTENLTQRELMERARKRCELFADRYPQDKYRNIVITGNAGLGKTFLLDCMVARARRRGVNVLSVSAFQLQRMMLDYHMGRDAAALDAAMTVPLLAIDDLGSEPVMENITLVYLTNLLNERAAAHAGLIITTNLTLNEFKKVYSERMFSRLFDARHSLTLTLVGADVRLGITGR